MITQMTMPTYSQGIRSFLELMIVASEFDFFRAEMFCIGHTFLDKRFVIECIDGESYCFSNVFNQQLTLHIFIIKVVGMDLLTIKTPKQNVVI